MTSVRRFLLFIVLAATAAGCASTRAKTPVAPLALDVPPPPARVIVPVEPDPPPPSAAPEPEARTQKPTRPRTVAPRPDPRADANRATAKPETPPADVSKPASPAPAETVTLQQELPASPAEMVRRVRQQLDQAKSDLARVNYGGLNADGKSQYDTAKRFIEQADQALKEKNVVFAGKLAEKAASLAAVVGR